MPLAFFLFYQFFLASPLLPVRLLGLAGTGSVDWSAAADPHVLAQALERLRKSKDGLPGGEFEEAASTARVAREVVMVGRLSFFLSYFVSFHSFYFVLFMLFHVISCYFMLFHLSSSHLIVLHFIAFHSIPYCFISPHLGLFVVPCFV